MEKEHMEVVWNALVPEAAELVRIPGKTEREDPWMSRSQTRTVVMPDRIEIGARLSSSFRSLFAWVCQFVSAKADLHAPDPQSLGARAGVGAARGRIAHCVYR
jgi:hypothetical protein